MDNTVTSQNNLLLDHVQDILRVFVLKTTGLSDQCRKDPLHYVTTMFHRIRNVEYIKRFQDDLTNDKTLPLLPSDPSSQKILALCFDKIIEQLTNKGLNEITVTAARKCFMSIISEIEALDQEHALNLLQHCIELSAGELLVLQAYHDADRKPDTSQAITNWVAALSQHTGIKSYERIKTHVDALTKKNFLVPKKTTNETPAISSKLSELGAAIALSIDAGERILRSL